MEEKSDNLGCFKVFIFIIIAMVVFIFIDALDGYLVASSKVKTVVANDAMDSVPADQAILDYIKG